MISAAGGCAVGHAANKGRRRYLNFFWSNGAGVDFQCLSKNNVKVHCLDPNILGFVKLLTPNVPKVFEIFHKTRLIGPNGQQR